MTHSAAPRAHTITVLAAVAIGAITLSGCSTQLQAVRVTDAAAMPREGAPYNLSFTQYDLVITRRLVACFEKLPDGKNGRPQMTIATEVAATRNEVRDPKRDYVIDFSQLRSFFKTTDVSIEYHDNGTLKAVNAKVEDQTGPFLTGLITSVGKAITVAGGGLLAMTEPPVVPPSCSRKALDALAGVKNYKATLDLATKNLQLAKDEVERLTRLAQAIGRGWTDGDRAQLQRRVAEMYAASAAQELATDQLAKALASVTVTTKRTWPEDGEVRRKAVKLLDALKLKELKLDDHNPWVDSTPAPNAQSVIGNNEVWINLFASTKIGETAACTQATCADDVPVGLKYRMPVPGALLLCSSGSCAELADADVHKVQERAISQLGPVMTLPLKNYPFMNQSIVATFNEAGMPTKLGFTQTPSPDKAAGVLGSLADEVSRQRKDRQPKSELDTLKDETALLKAKADLAAAQAALQPPKLAAQADSLAILNADTALLKAQVAKLEAEAALAKALAQVEKP
jgi:hypothetical protein